LEQVEVVVLVLLLVSLEATETIHQFRFQQLSLQQVVVAVVLHLLLVLQTVLRVEVLGVEQVQEHLAMLQEQQIKVLLEVVLPLLFH
jgi:hypothetical protein